MDTQRLHDWARSGGLACRVVGPEILGAARERLERLRDEGALEARFYRESLGGFRYLEGRRVRKPRSLVLLAMPRPAHSLTLEFEEGPRDYYLPPTYAAYNPTFDLVLGWFREGLGLEPDQADIVHAPLKSLAAMAGLIRYGRNNIGYVPGLGSYVQLFGIVTSFDLEPESGPCPVERQSLDRCRACRLCARACTAGAIDPDRFLLHAERCYVLFSESHDPLPETLSPPSTDCLIGCLKCQQVCPENKGLLRKEHTGIVLDREETEVFLSGGEQGPDSAWADIETRFLQLRTTEGLKTLSRNLRWLRARAGRSKT